MQRRGRQRPGRALRLRRPQLRRLPRLRRRRRRHLGRRRHHPLDDDDSTPLDDDDSTPLDDDDATDTFEGDEPGECADGIDNDGDFLTDCDDPTCNLTPECGGGDDDDATADPSGIPTITGIITSWLPATNQLQFDISMVDADCNLGDPILNWSFNGSPQPPYLLTGAGFTCGGVVTF